LGSRLHAAHLYFWAARMNLAAEAGPNTTLVGFVQIASALKVVSLPLVLLIVTPHWSGASPVVVPLAVFLIVTAVLVDGVNPPPPVTTIPAGQSTNASCCVPFGSGVSAEKTYKRSERRVSWNTVGPRGPRGATGATGYYRGYRSCWSDRAGWGCGRSRSARTGLTHLQRAASLNAPVDLLAQALIVAVDVVDAAIAHPAPTASRHAAATAMTGTRTRLSMVFMLTSSVDEADGLPLACLQLGEHSTAETHRRGEPTPQLSQVQGVEESASKGHQVACFRRSSALRFRAICFLRCAMLARHSAIHLA
jgi:hypothetical protein